MKKIFLTGASSGIGLATARALTDAGHGVWGTARDETRVPQMPRLHAVALDLARPNSVSASFEAAENEAGGFDVLINNAGSGRFGPTENLSPAELAAEFQVLVFGQIQLVQLALRGMRERGAGTIINVSSLAARLPVPFMASYSAAKAAMASFTITLNLELGGSGIRFVDIQPGDIRTNFNDAVAKFGTESTALTKTWRIVDENMRKAPPPELVARHILRALAVDNPPPRITVGDVFQARVAPFILRFLPMRLQLWGLRKYYGI